MHIVDEVYCRKIAAGHAASISRVLSHIFPQTIRLNIA